MSINVVVAVIVTFNRLNSLKEVVSKTLAQPFSRLVIVDNSSTDDTPSWLASLNDPRLVILTNPENTGGSGGFFTGLHWLKENVSETDPWVVLYDDDAFPHEDFLDSFSSIVSLHPNHSLFCSAVYDSEYNPVEMNTPIVRNARGFLDNIKAIFNRSSFALSEFSSPCNVECCSFVGMIAKSSVLVSRLEDFPRNFFIYYDDIFYTGVLSRYFGDFLFHPKLKFTHNVNFKKARSIRPVWKTYFYVRNMFAYYKEVTPRWYLLQVLPRVFLVLVMAMRDFKNSSEIIKFLFLGIKDALINNFEYNPLRIK